jgi:putative ABC transport system permease protein
MSLTQDLKHALRGFRNAPGFTTVAVLTLALGVGANSAVFSVVHAVLLRALPYPHAERLVTFKQNQSMPDLEDLVAASRSFEAFGGAAAPQAFDLTGGDEPVQLRGTFVTGGLFDVLGAKTVLGRTISPRDDAYDAPPTAVLSYEAWRSRFAADPALVGRAVTLSGTSYTVIGVLAAGVHVPEKDGDVYVPLKVANASGARARGVHFLRTVLRLREGVTFAAAQADMERVQRVLRDADPIENKDRAFPIQELRERLAGKTRPALLVLLGAAGVVLLIASANFANLLLARALSRKKELLIRTALGAGRARLVRQLLTESVLLAFTGGVAGLVLAPWVLRLLLALRPQELLSLFEVGIDVPVLLFTFAVALATGALFGLVPAAVLSRAEVSSGLAESSRGGTAGPNRSRLAGLLVVAELALALVLVVGAGLLARAFLRLHATDTGFVPAGLHTMRLELSESRYKEVAQQTAFREKLLATLRPLPDVQAGIVSELPLDDNWLSHNAVIEGHPVAPGEEPELGTRSVAGDYFSTMRIPLTSGRDFEAQDRENAPLVGIVNAAFVKTYAKDGQVLGKRVRWAREEGVNWITVVGVVGDVKHFGLERPEEPALYTPYDQVRARWKRWMYVVIRSGADQGAVERMVKAALKTVDPDLPITQSRTMTQVFGSSLARPRFSMALVGLFGVLALSLAAIGLYGVLSHAVAQRTREIGIRVALGAARREVLRLVVGQGMRLTLAGIAVGALGALAATRLLRSLLYGISPTDPVTYAALAALLTAVAFAACVVPAWRAARVDPIVALREE